MKIINRVPVPRNCAMYRRNHPHHTFILTNGVITIRYACNGKHA